MNKYGEAQGFNREEHKECRDARALPKQCFPSREGGPLVWVEG